MFRCINALGQLRTFTFGVILCVGSAEAQDIPKFDGPGGGDIKFNGTDIEKVDGPANWIITGNGQNLTIRDKKDGDGSLTLRNFGEITILKKKDGKGILIVDPTCRSITIKEVNGPGHTYLRNNGKKDISLKDGDGNVYYKGDKPAVTKIDGAGRVLQEQNN